MSGNGLLEFQELVGYPVFPCLCLPIFSNSYIPSFPAPTGLPKALRQESHNGFEVMEEKNSTGQETQLGDLDQDWSKVRDRAGDRVPVWRYL